VQARSGGCCARRHFEKKGETALSNLLVEGVGLAVVGFPRHTGEHRFAEATGKLDRPESKPLGIEEEEDIYLGVFEQFRRSYRRGAAQLPGFLLGPPRNLVAQDAHREVLRQRPEGRLVAPPLSAQPDDAHAERLRLACLFGLVVFRG
jgi:hypothetical protein